jgi:pyruvate/2-oxoglutarate dehydrogenase complex dihydrolipoamide acyltransferase (E2) component
MGLMEDAQVSSWLRADGDRVARGETLVAIQTDKVEVEVESPADGLLEIAVPAGPDRVPVDRVLGYVVDD